MLIVTPQRFNAKNPPKKIDFLAAFVLELVDRPGRPVCAVERFVHGEYVKHSNNDGWSDDRRNTPHAFRLDGGQTKLKIPFPNAVTSRGKHRKTNCSFAISKGLETSTLVSCGPTLIFLTAIARPSDPHHWNGRFRIWQQRFCVRRTGKNNDSDLRGSWDCTFLRDAPVQSNLPLLQLGDLTLQFDWSLTHSAPKEKYGQRCDSSQLWDGAQDTRGDDSDECNHGSVWEGKGLAVKLQVGSIGIKVECTPPPSCRCVISLVLSSPLPSQTLSQVARGSSADRSGQVTVGDEVVAVNGVDVTGRS